MDDEELKNVKRLETHLQQAELNKRLSLQVCVDLIIDP